MDFTCGVFEVETNLNFLFSLCNLFLGIKLTSCIAKDDLIQ